MCGTQMKRDSLGDRMKHQYEDRTRTYLPRRTHTIIRLDGKAFHTYTRGRMRPWDNFLHDHLVKAAQALFREAQGSVLAYVQSDEISLLLTDFSTIHTEAWFDGNIQKLASVSASIVTAEFNLLEMRDQPFGEISTRGRAHFDARVFTIPDPVEVHNYFVWRQKDAERNSLSMLAQSHFSHRELHGKKREDLHDMLHSIGVNWNDWPAAFRRGTAIEASCAVPAPIFTQDFVVPDMLTKARVAGDA